MNPQGCFEAASANNLKLCEYLTLPLPILNTEQAKNQDRTQSAGSAQIYAQVSSTLILAHTEDTTLAEVINDGCLVEDIQGNSRVSICIEGVVIWGHMFGNRWVFLLEEEHAGVP